MSNAYPRPGQRAANRPTTTVFGIDNSDDGDDDDRDEDMAMSGVSMAHLLQSAATRPSLSSSTSGGPPRPDYVCREQAMGESSSLHLPSQWSQRERASLVELSHGHLRVSYIGTGKTDADAGAVRANWPIPNGLVSNATGIATTSGSTTTSSSTLALAVYYFEVTVVSKGRDGYIAIGVCGPGVSLQRLPGWEPLSWGYHGDDGHAFGQSGTGRAFGPTFTTGDIVGCGVNFATNDIFFTKNGVNLGPAFRSQPLPDALFPTVGLRTPNEVVEANFGARPFRFDIVDYVRSTRATLLTAIEAVDIPPTSASAPSPSLSPADTIVLSYLLHHGHVETARALAITAGALPANYPVLEGNITATHDDAAALATLSTPSQRHLHRQLVDARYRLQIRAAVLQGQIDQAIEMVERWFPGALDERKGGGGGNGGNNDNTGLVCFHLRCRKFIELITRTVIATPFPSVTDKAHTDMQCDGDDDALMMEGVVSASKNEPPSSSSADTADEGMLDEALAYGQELQDAYRDDERVEVQSTLVRTFSLLAYPDPVNSVVGELLDPRNRIAVAEELSRHLLAFRNAPTTTPLETIYRQTTAILTRVLREHGGSAAGVLLDPRRTVLSELGGGRGF